MAQHTSAALGEAPQPTLNDLPDEVLALCLAQGLWSPCDLAGALLTCKRLYSIGRRAPVRLALHEPHTPAVTPTESRRRLGGLCASFPGVKELDVGGTPLEDADIAALAPSLCDLRVLALSGCKKLTGGVARTLFALPAQPATGGAASYAAQPAGAPAQLRLRSVVMQRCFQLTDAALSDALLAGMALQGSLGGVALSHLSLRGWPDAPLVAVLEAQSRRSRGEAPWPPAQQEQRQPEVGEAALAAAAQQQQQQQQQEQQLDGEAVQQAVALPLPTVLVALGTAAPRGLRMLALHNCSGVTVAALWAVARGCPALRCLFLGGSSLALQEAGGPLAVAAAAAAAAPGSVEAQLAPRLLPDVGQEAAAAVAGRPALAIELVPGQALPDDFCASNSSVHSVAAVRRAAAGALAGLRFARWADPLTLAAAAEFAALAALLLELEVVELTFGLPGLVPLLQQLCEEPALPGALPAAAGASSSASGWARLCDALGVWSSPSAAKPHCQRPVVQFWDLSQTDSVHQALAWRRSGNGSDNGSGGSSLPAEAAVFLRAAANCSSGAKVTPLHVAAEEGACGMLLDLLRLGADVLARDRSGASALFRACEAGHVDAARCLLAAGADVTQRNSAGEAPFYIAALRGHRSVVAVLLEYCEAEGIHWQDREMYGDGWTPLMAAAVGGHVGIASQLLAAAGPALAAELVGVTNRYGQTAVHIAARRGSWELVHCLLEAGGGAAVAAVVDGNGRTAADIARRNGNTPAWELLRALLLGAHQGTQEAEGGRGRRGRRARKAGAVAAGPLPTAAQQPAAQVPGTRMAQAGASAGPSPVQPAPAQGQPPAARQWVGRRLGARKSEASSAGESS